MTASHDHAIHDPARARAGYSVIPLPGKEPRLAPDVFIAPGSHIIGEVEIESGCGIWFNCVLRGDVTPITIGNNTNIQDGCTLHGAVIPRYFAVNIGSHVTVGHNVILHGCTIEDGAFIGMGAIILSGAKIGAGALIAAGTLVPEGKVIPPRAVVMGVPGRVVRSVTPEDEQMCREITAAYVQRAAMYRQMG